VTEIEDKASRRAQRREQQQTANEGAEGKSDAPASPVDSSASSEDATAIERVDEIRDRNARLRAQAAKERQAKREREKAAVAVPIGLDAGERMDDIFVRATHATAGWLRANFRWLQWVVIAGVVVGFGVQGYRYFVRSKAAKSADVLAIGLVAESGTVRATGNEEKSANPELEQIDPRPVYDSEPARLQAAEQGYRKAIATHGKSGAGWLARLGLAGVLYDQQKWDEALELYRAVRASVIAKADPDLLGRSLEGIGLVLEGKGDREGALQAFRELTNQEGAPWLGTQGLYHQARILAAQGNQDKAKELATKAKERLEKEKQDKAGKDKDASPARSGFLSESVRMLLARIDPASAQGAAGRNIADVLRDDPAKLQRMLEGLKDPSEPTLPSGPAESGDPK
jgi:tetratricopeptide (TPR) repeat protein